MLYPFQTPDILMSKTNPNGWKLESLLTKLITEVEHKSEQITGSPHPQRDMILKHNVQIMDLLTAAKEVQEETYKQLDMVEPNKGPLNPRL